MCWSNRSGVAATEVVLQQRGMVLEQQEMVLQQQGNGVAATGNGVAATGVPSPQSNSFETFVLGYFPS